jgi:colicin import membrane protein
LSVLQRLRANDYKLLATVVRTGEQLNQDLAGVQEELAAARTREDQVARELEKAQTAAATAQQEAETAIAGLRTDMDAVRVRLNQVEQERDAAVARAGAEEKARVEAERRAAAAESRAESQTARAEREETAAAEARDQLTGSRAEVETARETVAEMRSTAATLTAERDAARADVERERSHGEQRVKDLHDTYKGQITQLRDELTQARTAGTKQPRPRPRADGES